MDPRPLRQVQRPPFPNPLEVAREMAPGKPRREYAKVAAPV